MVPTLPRKILPSFLADFQAFHSLSFSFQSKLSPTNPKPQPSPLKCKCHVPHWGWKLCENIHTLRIHGFSYFVYPTLCSPLLTDHVVFDSSWAANSKPGQMTTKSSWNGGHFSLNNNSSSHPTLGSQAQGQTENGATKVSILIGSVSSVWLIWKHILRPSSQNFMVGGKKTDLGWFPLSKSWAGNQKHFTCLCIVKTEDACIH